MASRYSIKCIECGKSEKFVDEHDVRQAKWKIIAWNVKTGDPKCICEKCEYKPISNK